MRRLTTRSIVIAAGAQPGEPELPGLEQVGYLTTGTLWDALGQLDEIPRRLLLLGGGPVGCELTQAFARLGAQMLLLEAGPRLLAREDDEVSDGSAAPHVTVSLAHVHVPSPNWPSMSMGFKVEDKDKALFAKFAKTKTVVDMEFIQEGNDYVVTSRRSDAQREVRDRSGPTCCRALAINPLPALGAL